MRSPACPACLPACLPERLPACLPACLQDRLGELGLKVFVGVHQPREQVVVDDSNFVFAPMLTRNNTLGSYLADKDRTVRYSEDCVKFTKVHRGLSEGAWLGWLAGLRGCVVSLCAFHSPLPPPPPAGLLVLYCPHRLCVGFQILTRHEGPRIAFELLFRRLSTGPRLIVYDNVSARLCVLLVLLVLLVRADAADAGAGAC